MQIKRRLGGIIFVFLCLVFLTLLMKHNITYLPQQQDTLHHYKTETSSFDTFRRINALEKFIKIIDSLTKEIDSLKKTFVRNTKEVIANSQKKDIYIDILNNGDQKHCQNVTLLVMITSHATHEDRRNIIRSNWANNSLWNNFTSKRNFTYGMLFLVGNTKNESLSRKLFQESKKHGDLLIEEISESFYSLSYKVMIGFQWIDDQCTFDFLLKGDDDIFVNVHQLVNLLHEPYIPKTQLYIGHMMAISSVMRNGRYGVSRKEYLRDYYPRYCSGGGFIMSRDVVRAMIPHYDWLNPLKIDDAYMGHLVLKAGIDALHDTRFRMYEKNCTYIPEAIIEHIWNNEAVEPTCAKYLNEQALKAVL